MLHTTFLYKIIYLYSLCLPFLWNFYLFLLSSYRRVETRSKKYVVQQGLFNVSIPNGDQGVCFFTGQIFQTILLILLVSLYPFAHYFNRCLLVFGARVNSVFQGILNHLQTIGLDFLTTKNFFVFNIGIHNGCIFSTYLNNFHLYRFLFLLFFAWWLLSFLVGGYLYPLLAISYSFLIALLTHCLPITDGISIG